MDRTIVFRSLPYRKQQSRAVQELGYDNEGMEAENPLYGMRAATPFRPVVISVASPEDVFAIH